MDKIALEAMREEILKNPSAFSRDALLGWIMSAGDEINRLEDAHECSRCGTPNPEHEDMDGCRDPDCPENDRL